MKKIPKLKLLETAYRIDQLKGLRGPVVLFLGRSNVGKSSLLNSLGGTTIAQISKTPGKTRSVNYYLMGKKLTWVDLPGYGYARRSKREREDWAELMRAFFEELPDSSLGFLLMDCKRNLQSEEEDLIFSLLERGHEVQVLLTKADRLGQAERQARSDYMEQWIRQHKLENILTWRFVSVRKREGLGEIRSLINRYEKEHPL